MDRVCSHEGQEIVKHYHLVHQDTATTFIIQGTITILIELGIAFLVWQITRIVRSL